MILTFIIITYNIIMTQYSKNGDIILILSIILYYYHTNYNGSTGLETWNVCDNCSDDNIMAYLTITEKL